MPPGGAAEAITTTSQLWFDLHDLEAANGLDSLKEPDWGFAHIMYRWAKGSSLAGVLEGTDLSAGDFVRWSKQVIDLLGQIADVAPAPIERRCHEAAALIDRGVIRYSSLP